MFAVADHDSCRRVRVLGNGIREQIDLVGARAIEFAAVNRFEELPHAKMLDNAFRLHVRLAGGDEQLVAGCADGVSSASRMPS